MIQELFIKPVLVFGCGNPLFGDDGFGPAVIEHLMMHYSLPDSVLAVDAGTSIRDFLFDLLLAPVKPSQIHIVDAVSLPDRQPGEIFKLELDKIPIPKASDFSLHQFPSVNLLREMNSLTCVDVQVLAVQAGHIPDFVQPGLSPQVQKAVEPACRWLLYQIGRAEGEDRDATSVVSSTVMRLPGGTKTKDQKQTT
ncbi:MAG: hydrogenase maturation protease [Desulfobacteraceae bacterium]|nr:MAG: hydrogenase maturation protease [Desulfobacteraceae bacterium]